MKDTSSFRGGAFREPAKGGNPEINGGACRNRDFPLAVQEKMRKFAI